jgi:hypothetical protein
MNKRILKKVRVDAVDARLVKENPLIPKKLRAAKKRESLAAAVVEASKIEIVIDRERGDPYSLRRMEKEF